MYLNIVKFLLKTPPLEEIGGKISHIIEQYRAGVLEEQVCITRILNEHAQYIKDYAIQSNIINQQLY